MEKLHNLKDRICSFENLIGAYRDAAKGKRDRDEVIKYQLDLAENLLELREDLLNMTYKVGPYREFYVRYPKPRLVMALGFRDRIVQWAIYRQINPYLEKRYTNHSYGCRKGKGTLAAARQLYEWQQLISRKQDADDWYIVKGDVSKYFYRVSHTKMLEIYAELTDDAWFAWLIGTIIDNPDVPFGLPPGMRPDDCPRQERLYEVGMPIGNLTSQETANLFLDKLDEYCKHELHLHFYIRYMDDFCFFVKGKENANKAFSAVEKFLNAELLLEMSPKSRIQKAADPIEYVGYLITPHGMRVRKKTTRHIKRSVPYILNAYSCGAISLKSALERKQCYIGMFKNCSGHNMIRWIEDNFVLRQNENAMSINDSPGRRFYSINKNDDGTVDVYLRPDVLPRALEIDRTDCDIVLVVRSVEPFEGIEENIRQFYNDWCESAEVIYL